MHFVTRVMAWNAARYDQQSNTNLTLKLLAEEAQELNEAPNLVEVLDALGDITFVAVGALWKLGCAEDDVVAVFDHIFTPGGITIASVHDLAQQLSNSGGLSLTATKDDATLITTVLSVMVFIVAPVANAHGYFEVMHDLLDIICTSNESKAVPDRKVDASIKANSTGSGGKGPNYVAPDAAIVKLIGAVNLRNDVTNSAKSILDRVN